MNKLRWLMGAALAVLALLACVQAMGVYVQHQLWLGAGTVAVLALMDVAGFVSLWRARLDMAAQWTALTSATSGGALLEERRTRLRAIHAAGGIPNVDALSMATAAQQRQHAYLGRYVVTVTVLVGLVGTFAGLMETLRTVTPLLHNGTGNTFELLAAPLSGLDVTFGASLVAILVTLALTMVQGDLVLAEEATLARLDELTQHVLIPQVWPAATRPEERTLAEMTALRADLKAWSEATSTRAAESVHTAARAELEALTRRVDGILKETLERNAALLKEGAADTARAVQGVLGPAVEAQGQRLSKLAADVTEAIRDGATSAQKAADAQAKGVEALSRSVSEGVEKAARSSVDALTQAHARHAEGWKDILTALEREHTSVVGAMKDAAASVTADLGGASAAAREVLQGVQAASMAALGSQEKNAQKVTAALEAMVREQTAQAAATQKAQQDSVTALSAALAHAGEQAAQHAGAARQAQQDAVKSLASALAAEAERASVEAKASRQAQQEAVQALSTALAREAAEAGARLHKDASDVAAALSAAVKALAESAEGSRGAHARALEEQSTALGGQFRELAEGLSRSVNTVTERLERTAQQQLEALSRGAALVQEAQKALVTTSDEHARRAATEMHQFIQGLVQSHAGALEKQSAELGGALRETASQFAVAVETARETLSHTSQSASEGWTVLHRGVDASVEQLGSSLKAQADAVQAALASLAQGQAHALADSATRVEAALQQGLMTAGKNLDTSVLELGNAAAQLKAGAEALQPVLGSLVPELQAMARELALLAARNSETDPSGAMLDEMNRLGEGMDRLSNLVRAARSAQS